MSEHADTWFTDPEFLKRMGRDLLPCFFAAFAADLQADNVTLPDPSLPDDRYFPEAARFLDARRRRQWLSRNHLPVSLRVPGFTLDPLRDLGSDALVVIDVPGIVKITLCAITVIYSNGHCDTRSCRSDDLFEARSPQGAPHPAIPRAGKLTRAVLRVQFADAAVPRAVELWPPQTLHLVHAADAEPVGRWLVRRRFQFP
jgi:hypothetical protein